jgi:undecaprenyl-diphosphatase
MVLLPREAICPAGRWDETCYRCRRPQARGHSMSDYLIAVILGIVEGLTEFLPISSTGHLILANRMLGLNEADWATFDVMIQLGAILAIVCLYLQRLWAVLIGLPSSPAARQFALVILVAVVPSLMLGAIFGGTIKALLFSPLVVGITLILGGIVILVVENLYREPIHRNVESIPVATALMIGLVQTVSMIPGTSRSGATIIGGLLLGLERKTAAEFSFFLAIPTMLAAFAYEAYSNRHELDFSHAGVIAIGFAVSFLSALLVVKPFLGIIGRFGFAPFAYYRVAVGTLVLSLLWL